MQQTTYIIYKLTSPSGKSYIGQTCDFTRRIKEHQTRKCCPLLCKAIEKHTWDSFNIEILYSELNMDEANVLEEQLISQYNTLTPNGYNLIPGGKNHSRQRTPESIIKGLNTTLKNNNGVHPSTGRVKTTEEIEKAKATKEKNGTGKGHKQSLEVINKRKATKEKNGTGKGLIRPESVRQKISESHLGRKRGPQNIDVVVKRTRKQKRQVIADGLLFDSLKEAGSFLNIHPSLINYRIKIKREGYSYNDEGYCNKENVEI
jgi:group I intron endonuclease